MGCCISTSEESLTSRKQSARESGKQPVASRPKPVEFTKRPVAPVQLAEVDTTGEGEGEDDSEEEFRMNPLGSLCLGQNSARDLMSIIDGVEPASKTSTEALKNKRTSIPKASKILTKSPSKKKTPSSSKTSTKSSEEQRQQGLKITPSSEEKRQQDLETARIRENAKLEKDRKESEKFLRREERNRQRAVNHILKKSAQMFRN